MGAEDDGNRPAGYWVVAGREDWFIPWYGWYLVKFTVFVTGWDDGNVVRLIAVTAVLAADILWRGEPNIWFNTALFLLSASTLARCSLDQNASVACFICWFCVVSSDCQGEWCEVLVWLADERLLDDKADDLASEYEMPVLPAEDGASSDRALADLYIDPEVAYLWRKSVITFAVAECWWTFDEGNSGKRDEELAVHWATDVASWAGWVLAKDGATTAVERFAVQETYGGNESRRNSVDGNVWAFARSTLYVDIVPDFMGENCDKLVTPDDSEVSIVCGTCSNSSTWLLDTTLGETIAATSGAFRSKDDEPPETN